MSDAPRSPSLRSPDRSPSLRQRLSRGLDALDKRLEGSAERRAGVCIGDCAGGIDKLDCAGLAREKRAVEEAQEKARLSDEVYKDKAAQRLPPGYSHATEDDLEKLGLLDRETGENLLSNPDAPDFHAQAYKHDASGRYTIAFRGTDPGRMGDLRADAGQSLGLKTAHYSQAIEIGTRTAQYQSGNVEFTGHSLGGGLASAAAFNSGSPATTFNTAGLHRRFMPRNIPNPRVHDWYVKGEGLSGAQDGSWILPGARGRRLPLDPAFRGVRNWRTYDRSVMRDFRLHGIGEVRDALGAKHDAIGELQRKKGCPQ